jgi:pimeloyl-ACP methyl ester carboxylesterase
LALSIRGGAAKAEETVVKVKVKQKKLKFASRDGLKLHGTLATPSSGIDGALLMVHGITSDRNEWGIFELVAEELANDGIASLRFDFRGHGDSALDENLISLSGIFSDVLAAWDELEGHLDTEGRRFRRYTLGSSYGGGLSYAAASRIGRIDRAFMMAPVLNYLTDLENCAPKWLSDLKNKGHLKYNDLKLGRPLANEAMYFDPLAGAAVPATIFHGTLDTDVSIDLSRDAAARHPNLELVPVEGAGHVLNVPEDFDLEDDASWAYVRFMIDQIRNRIG